LVDRHRDDATPGLYWIINQLEYFLGFIGLASLIAVGTGRVRAVSADLQVRRPSIATLKALCGSGVLIPQCLFESRSACRRARRRQIGVVYGGRRSAHPRPPGSRVQLPDPGPVSPLSGPAAQGAPPLACLSARRLSAYGPLVPLPHHPAGQPAATTCPVGWETSR